MAYLIFTLIVVVLALVFTYLRNYYLYWERRGVPYEHPLYIFGNMKGLGTKFHIRDINDRIYKQFKNKSPFAGIFLFFSKTAFITDLDLVKNVLIKDFPKFRDRGFFNNVRDDPLTGHLFTLEGEPWRALRNKLSPVFTSGKMKFMLPTIAKVSENFGKSCGKLMEEDEEGSVEVKELSARYTTDVIGTCAFGIECNSLEDPNAEFREKGRSIFAKPRHSQIVQGLIITNPKLARKLRCKFFPDDVSNFFIDAVKRTVDYRIKNNIKRNDFMDLLIEMRAKDDAGAESNDGIDLSKGLSLLQMAAQAFVFFVAGFDTSSTTMSFCLHELAINQDVQEKLRDEIKSVLAKHNNEVTYEAVKEMQYLDQIVSETLRKYSVLPHLIRKANEDFYVPNTKFTIEKGTTIIIPIHCFQHDPEIFPNPEKFDPSRFDPEAVKKRHPCAFMPFGEGPRHCIGKRFGLMQTKVGLIALIKDYKFGKSSKTQDKIQLSKKNVIICAEKGLHVKVERL